MSAVEISPASARELTDRIKVGVDAIWELIKQAYTSRAWSVLGYSSWDDYCTREFGTSRIRLPREERQEVVASMREIGMSVRAISSAIGDSYGTVRNELAAREQNCSPETEAPAPITGTDGKTYAPRPKPEPEFDPDEEIVPGMTAGQLDELNVQPQQHPEPAAEPAAPAKPKRRALDDQFLDATYQLTRVCTTLQNLGDDDRLPRNREQVARYRSDLLRAIDTLHRVADQLS